MASTEPRVRAWQKAHWHDSKLPLIVGVNVVLMVMTTLATMVRLAAKKVSKAPFREDDYTLVIALASLIRALFVHGQGELTRRQVLAYGVCLENMVGKSHPSYRRALRECGLWLTIVEATRYGMGHHMFTIDKGTLQQFFRVTERFVNARHEKASS